MTGGSDGLTLAQAIAQADRHLREARQEFDRDALRLTNAMAAVFKSATLEDLDRVEPLYGLAGQLLDLAGAVDRKPLGEAAYAFCAMLDRMRRTGRWNASSVAVFIESLRRLHAANDDCTVAAKIVLGLKRVAAASRA